MEPFDTDHDRPSPEVAKYCAPDRPSLRPLNDRKRWPPSEMSAGFLVTVSQAGKTSRAGVVTAPFASRIDVKYAWLPGDWRWGQSTCRAEPNQAAVGSSMLPTSG